MRDGSLFYHVAPCLVGHAHNMPSPSREAEIWCRKKVFQLQYWHFIERGFTDLITPRFSIVKAVVDIRVVWNSKLNGHNATLWAPGFMLDDIGDVIEMVTKWLAVPVADYLDSGSPSQDYTQPTSIFIKSKQGDIDVGACSTISLSTFPRGMSWEFMSSTRHWKGEMNTMNSGGSVHSIFEDALPPTLPVNLSVLFSTCVKVIDTMSTIFGNGTTFGSIFRALRITIPRCPG